MYTAAAPAPAPSHAHKLQINILNVITIAGRRKCGAALRVQLQRFMPPTVATCHKRQWQLILSGGVALLVLALLLLLLLVLFANNNNNNNNQHNNGNITNANATVSDHIRTQSRRHKLNENPNWRQQNNNNNDSNNSSMICNSEDDNLAKGSNDNQPAGRSGHKVVEENNRSSIGNITNCLCHTTNSRCNSNNNSARICSGNHHCSDNNNADSWTIANASTYACGNCTHQILTLGSAAKRERRFILFSGGGVVKLVIGISLPIMLVDKQRSLSYFYNLQLQYAPPPRPLYWWSLYNTSTFAARREQRAQPHFLGPGQQISRDLSRSQMYAAIEQIYERHALPGEACLLQAICEISQRPFEVATPSLHSFTRLLHKIFNAIFIPTLPNVAAKYLNARRAGVQGGVDCQQIYGNCPKAAHEWLTRLTHFNV